MSKHTPEPWVYGHWMILDEDRPAQVRGDPYWTLEKASAYGYAGNVITTGPLGRKALHPNSIIGVVGAETEGIEIENPANARLIAKAPEMLEFIREVAGEADSSRVAKAAQDLVAEIEGGE